MAVRTTSDARQTIIRRFLEQLASKTDFDGTSDSKAASSTELDNLLDSLNVELKQPLRMDASTPNDRVITVGPAIVTNTATTRNRSIPHIGTLLPNSFASGTYTFPSADAGTIVASPGVNGILNCPSGQYVKVLLYMDTLGLLNVLVGDPNAVEATATVLPAPDSSLPMGYVTIHNTGGTIDVISQSKIYQFGNGAGGSGSGDSLNLDVILRDRFAVTDFEFLEENILKRDQSTKVDTGASTGSFSFAKSAYLLSSVGQKLVSYNLIDPLFSAEGVDITDVEFYLQWLFGFVDTAATYEASRDGGTNWSTVTMAAVGTQDYRGYLTFADESVQQSLQTYAVGNGDTSSPLTASGNTQAVAQKFTVTSTEVLRSMDIYVNKTQTSGTVAGKYKVSIIRDSAGSPSLAAQDNISESDLKNLSDLSVGLNTVTITMPQVVMVPGDYWIVWSTDADYKASYLTGQRSLDIRSDSTSPTAPIGYQFNGTVWAATSGPAVAYVYLLKGRVHDLRVRVTSGTVTKYIEGYGVYYGLQSGVTSASGERSFQKFYFTGDENRTDFTLTFTPDPELLEILDPYRGQSYAIEEGVARIIGQVVRFDPNTFNFPGENIVLWFRQVKGSTIDNSNANAVAISTINSNLIDVGNQLADTQRVSIPLISVPNTTIINRAQIPDPSQDLKPRLAIERIMTQNSFQLQNEFGAAGELVYGILNDDRGLIRFVGNWANATDSNAGSANGTYVNTPNSGTGNDYVEITFYGTGLNILNLLVANARDLRYTVDGGVESANFYPATASSILNGRNYSSNQILPVVSGLTLGTHTVKVRSASVTFGALIMGFEVLNENIVATTGNTHTSTLVDNIPSTSQLAIGMSVSGSGVPSGTTISSIDSATQVTISAATTSTLTATALNFFGSLKINPGSSYNAGKKLTLASAQTQSYKSGFETGTLGTRGGRVLVYQKSDGTVAKAVQPTDAAQANIASANHANEEVTRTYHWREFGTRNGLAADDFSSLTTTSSSRAFSLDDGTTLLVGQNNLSFTNDSLSVSGNGDWFTLTFVGTGLDIAETATSKKIYKIVSGLPYGTHTFRMTFTTGPIWAASIDGTSIGTFSTVATQGFQKFIVYGPKKPTLPTGAVELADYNIMANFVANSTSGIETISTGVLRKSLAQREAAYIGTWAATIGVGNYPGGWNETTSTGGSYVEYIFYGTGFDWRNFASTVNATFTIDGATDFTVANLSPAYGAGWSGALTTSSYGHTSFTASTGVLVDTALANAGAGVSIRGLNLGIHKVRFAYNSGTNLNSECIDIITPIHSPKSNIFADLQNTLSVGSCGISDNRPTKTIKELTTLPSKAWAQVVGISSGPTMASGTALPMPDMSLTIKTSGGPLDISFVGEFENSTSVGLPAAWLIYMDGVIVDQEKQWNTSGAGYSVIFSSHFVIAAAAGTHKIDVFWRSPSVGTMIAKGTRRILTVQEK